MTGQGMQFWWDFYAITAFSRWLPWLVIPFQQHKMVFDMLKTPVLIIDNGLLIGINLLPGYIFIEGVCYLWNMKVLCPKRSYC